MTDASSEKRHGVFITFEGGEGAGKSTQIRRLASAFRAAEFAVVETREPGGSPGAEAIRTLLVQGTSDRWSPVTEALLMNAARRDHIERVIVPALARGDVVLCDRFHDSTMAYQGIAGGLGEEKAAALAGIVVESVIPDLTIVLDLPVETGLSRSEQRGGDARFESKGADYHERVRRAFLTIAERHKDRCSVINADQTADAVFRDIMSVVRERLPAIAGALSIESGDA